MTIRNFTTWCETAVADIIFPPDRDAVYEELLNHLNDHYDDLVEQGLDSETARAVALSSMGDPKEIAPQLAAIHRPFWGYFLRFTRVALVLALCVTLWCAWVAYEPYTDPFDGGAFNPYTDTHHEDLYSNWTPMFYAEPNRSVQCDGYTLTLTQAAEWHQTYLGEDLTNKEQDHFYCQIEVFNPRPWAAHTDIANWFWAVDSLGNSYDRFYQSIANYAPFMMGSMYHSGPLTYTHDVWISNYCSQEAEWIEFHYDRSGRDIVFRLNLTGGDAA